MATRCWRSARCGTSRALHLVTDDDPDPIPNTGTVTGDTDEGEGGDEVTDTDDHVVDIIHPGIEIVKTVDEETVPIGTTVTYTYVITNTGDTTLYDISVDDDILGHIGDIEVLEPGQSVTLTKDFVVGDEPSPTSARPMATTSSVAGELPRRRHRDPDRRRSPGRRPVHGRPTSRTSRASTSPSPARSRFRSVRTIEYTITVTNTGNEALEGVTVDDTLLGDITGDFDSATSRTRSRWVRRPRRGRLLHAGGRRPRPDHQHGDRDGHRCGLGCGGLRRRVLRDRHHARAGHRRHQVLPGVGAVR